jgi:hypothetical protein
MCVNNLEDQRRVFAFIYESLYVINALNHNDTSTEDDVLFILKIALGLQY